MFELRFAHVTSPTTPKGLAAEYFAEQVEELSDGRIEVEVFPNSELYGDKDEMQAIQSNAVQVLAPASAKFTTIAPSLQVLDLPFIFEGLDEIPEVVNPGTAIGEAIYTNPDLEANGIKVIGLWDSGMKQLHANNEMLEPDDLRGRKFRIQPSDVLRTQFDTWQGIPSPLAFAEVYSGLQQGLIDGGENTYSNIASQNMHTVQRHITELNHGYIGYILTVNKRWYDELPEDLQSAVETAAERASEFNRSKAKEVNDEAKRLIQEAGNTKIHEPTEEERDAFKKLVVPSEYERYREVIGPDVIDELLERDLEREER
ncbi:DctP family TRAP transporter solute-binding subunit [Brevibacterium luteolum]|uniref:DctP family TRAP transporter solute-binding subunit n=1 Tax=Brevibacterium luteolum TaxID=199591 RepID=UPI003EF04BF7